MIEGVPMNEPKENLSAEVQEMYNAWDEMAQYPELLTDLSEKNVVFAAGGGLPSRFGVEESEIWQALSRNAQEGIVQVAGINFTLDDLALIGDYYRFLRDEKNFALHCIDERLVDDVAHGSTEVHDKCGACAAIAAAGGIQGNVEDILLAELGQESKQGVYDDMPDHESLSILVDFHGADVVLGKKREELKAQKALPFNVSIPLEYVAQWAESRGQQAADLLPILAQWNVQIARNIIGGHHNTLHAEADKAQIITDQRGEDGNPLLEPALAAVSAVPHGRLVAISD